MLAQGISKEQWERDQSAKQTLFLKLVGILGRGSYYERAINCEISVSVCIFIISLSLSHPLPSCFPHPLTPTHIGLLYRRKSGSACSCASPCCVMSCRGRGRRSAERSTCGRRREHSFRRKVKQRGFLQEPPRGLCSRYVRLLTLHCTASLLIYSIHFRKIIAQYHAIKAPYSRTLNTK